MSIVQNTTIDNYFVGYAYKFQSNQGPTPEYFNRYSPIVAIGLHYAILLFELVTRVLLVKVFFGIIYCLNCLCI